ncbi:MAG TPA: RDD family protein [Alphaproteobacteria bacterium]|jgi:uncharacterized RDD family membrane protein YckC
MTDATQTTTRKRLPRPSSARRGDDPFQDRLVDPAYYRNVLWRRMFAHVVDTLIVALVMAPVLIGLLLTAIVTLGLVAIPLALAFIVVRALYYILYTGGARSATPGMRLFGIELRAIDGGRPGYLQTAIRTLLYYATIAVFTPLILLVVLFNRQGRGVHDYLSGTVVVNRLEVAILRT